jgi:hypothetical protein
MFMRNDSSAEIGSGVQFNYSVLRIVCMGPVRKRTSERQTIVTSVGYQTVVVDGAVSTDTMRVSLRKHWISIKIMIVSVVEVGLDLAAAAVVSVGFSFARLVSTIIVDNRTVSPVRMGLNLIRLAHAFSMLMLCQRRVCCSVTMATTNVGHGSIAIVSVKLSLARVGTSTISTMSMGIEIDTIGHYNCSISIRMLMIHRHTERIATVIMIVSVYGGYGSVRRVVMSVLFPSGWRGIRAMSMSRNTDSRIMLMV